MIRFTVQLSTIITALVLPLFLFSVAQAESEKNRPQVIVSPRAIVNGGDVRLENIAEISSRSIEDKELLNTLRSIKVTDAPPPRSSTTVTGFKILSLMQKAGIETDKIAYSIPKSVSIESAGRTLDKSEVLNAVRKVLQSTKTGELRVHDVSWSHKQTIPLGETNFSVDVLGEPSGGKIPLRVEADVAGTPVARFLASAVVDFWREVPVLTRSMSRGMMIGPQDFQLVRINLNRQPADIVLRAEDLLGRQVKNRMAAGETIRRTYIDIPPTVARGTTVTMVYTVPGLRATALGMALDDGLEGETIRVQNTTSRKIVRARIISPEKVEIASR